MKQPKISVIMTCYNKEKFLVDAISSVLAQTLTRWELIIVDDGSTDASCEIILAFLRKNPKANISCVFSTHGGCAAATDRGLRVATAPICTMLDGDDMLEDTSLQVIFEAFENAPGIGFLWTRYICKGETSSKWKEGRSKALPEGMTLKQAYLSGWWGALSQRAFRTKTYLATGGLDHKLRYAVDQQLAMLFAEAGVGAMHLPVVTYRHIQYDQQMSAQHYGDQQACRREIMARLGGNYTKET